MRALNCYHLLVRPGSTEFSLPFDQKTRWLSGSSVEILKVVIYAFLSSNGRHLIGPWITKPRIRSVRPADAKHSEIFSR
jgi:hypothetical protein